MKPQQHPLIFLIMLFRLGGMANAFRAAGGIARNHNMQQKLIRNRAILQPFHTSYYPQQQQFVSRLFSAPPPNSGTTHDASSFSDSIQHSTTSSIMEGLNPSQVDAVTQPLSAITRVLAGPGSGKTKVLTCRIAYLLEEDRRNKILAVTFTRKASGEMQKRVESILKQQQNVEDELLYPPKSDDDMIYPPGFHSQEELDHQSIVQEETPGVPKGLDRVTLGTFHSVCAKILRFNGNLLASLPSVVEDMTGGAPVNLDGSFVILDQSDQLRILKECLDEAEIDLKKSGLKPLVILSAIGSIKESFSQGIDPFNTGDKRKPVPKSIRLARDVYGIYREKLFTNNAVDFDDLIFLTRELLTEDKELRQRLHKRWTHILVDEFQDTSRSQMDLVKLLTSSSLFVVGDADQSIYSWRGAHAGSMSDFATEFQNWGGNDDVVTVYLKENYRSTSNIVRAAEKVISMSGTEARRSMKPKRGSGPSPRVVACKDERAEAEFVVDNIAQMLIEGEIKPDQTAAIIYRTNAQSRYLEEACVQKNLPYVIRGGGASFYKRAEVKDCLCFLRWLHNGNDEGSMIRAVKTPSRGIGEAALREFREYLMEVDSYYTENYPDAKRLSPLDVLIAMTDGESNSASILAEGSPEASVFISKRAMNRFLPFSTKMRAIRENAYSLTVDQLLFYIIEELELVNHFDTISKSKAEFEERRENVQELRQASKRYVKYGPALKPRDVNPDDEFASETALGDFLDDVALVADVTEGGDEASKNENRFVVNLMTIHGSKGMEFDTVFVVGNEEGTLPSSRSIQEGEGSVPLEEEKRLCYVAMTRAKTRLLMTWRKEVTNFATWSDDGPRTSKKDRSRFLDALVSKKSPNSKSGQRNGGPKSQARDADSILGQRRSSRPESGSSRPLKTTRQAPTSRSFSSRPYPSQTKSAGTSTRVKPPTSRRDADYSPTPVIGTPRPSRPYLSHARKEEQSPQPRRQAINNRARPPPSASIEPPTPRRQAINNRARPPPGASIEPPTINPRQALIRPTSNDRARPRPSNGVPKKKPSPSFETARAPSPTAKSTAENSKKRAQMDSTWFFPVGSQVVHEKFGKGKVLEPPRDAPPGTELPVLVQFSDGSQKHFCAKGSDVVPDLGL